MIRTVMARGVRIDFESPYSDAVALMKLGNLDKPGTFGEDLLAKESRGLSPAQWNWVHKIVVDAEAPKAPVPSSATLKPLVDLMAKARESIKFPKITFELDGVHIQLKLAGPRSRNAGCINITDGEKFGENVWYGRIDTDGRLIPSRSLTPAISQILEQLSADPAGYSAAYGKKTGNCCFCCRQLTDERSTSVGYGPVCADNYGLPWGGSEPKAEPVEPKEEAAMDETIAALLAEMSQTT